jgi:hypothetical protein
MKNIRKITDRRLTRRSFMQTAGAITTVILSGSASKPLRAGPASTADPLSSGFVQPPSATKVHVQYWWMAGVRKEDITQDLEAMKREGIHGALLWPDDANFEPDKKDVLLELLRHAMEEAQRLGMEVLVKAMQGATTMAGYWIDQEHALKRPVWSEVEVTGPQEHLRIDVKPKTQDGFYRDVAVLALKVRSAEKSPMNHIKMAGAKITASPTITSPAFVVDGDATTAAVVAHLRRRDYPISVLDLAQIPSHDPKWIAFEFPQPYTASAVFVSVNNHMNMPTECELQQSDDGDRYSTICRWQARMDEPITVPFKETRARFYRLVITDTNTSNLRPLPELRQFDLLKEGELPAWPLRINHWLVRTGQAAGVPWYDPEILERQATRVAPQEADVAIEDVVDLTGRLSPDGQLEWDVPPGRWTILRFGYTLVVFPSMVRPDRAKWYFCDVLSQEAAKMAFRGLPEKILETAGPFVGRTLKFLHEDSWEVVWNMFWTPSFPEEFKRRRKYDLRSYLPALAGKVVGSGEITDRFLWDYRRTVADLMADNYLATLSELCRKRRIGYHSEIPAGYTSGLLDSLQLHARADEISGEFWARSDENDPKSVFMELTSRRFGDAVTTAASAAHTWGKKIVDAEAFTHYSNCYDKDFFDFKDIGDRAFCRGLNQMSILGYTSQNDKVPGSSIGWFCDDWNRHNTWWNQSHAWFTYLARCQFLLQQGLFQADLCYFNGEGVPSAVAGREFMDPPVPAGYSYDACSTEVLHQRMTVKGGRLALPDGMNYRVLVLPVRETMTPEALRRIAELVQEGAVVVGPRPKRSPSLASYPGCDTEVTRVASQVWGDCDGTTALEHRFGKGRVFWSKELGEVLAQLGVEPDFDYVSRQKEPNVMYIHRQAGSADIYFISNQCNRFEELECTFRIEGKVPELWHPDTGKIARQALYESRGHRTTLPLRLEPRGSVFVVFREPARGKRIVSITLDGRAVVAGSSDEVKDPPVLELVGTDGCTMELTAWEAGRYEMKTATGRMVRVQVPPVPPPLTLSGPWEVRFPAGWGAPESVVFPKLISWAEHDDAGVKYFSGTATYLKEIEIPGRMWGAGQAVFIDLGRLRNIAEVKLNGKDLGVLWKPPFRVEITPAANPGKNLLEVRVTNLWPNRLIGDESRPREKRRTWTNVQRYAKGWPLFESGLLGPVQIQAAERKKIALVSGSGAEG